MQKKSVVYETGERLSREMVTNVPTFTRYAQQELGLSLPLGNGRRQAWMGYCKEEMKVQGWGPQQLALTVDFIKATGAKCRTLHGILWYVNDAEDWSNRLTVRDNDEDLHMKVANALAIEQDEGWARKLSLAKGKALELVYANWVAERALG